MITNYVLDILDLLLLSITEFVLSLSSSYLFFFFLWQPRMLVNRYLGRAMKKKKKKERKRRGEGEANPKIKVNKKKEKKNEKMKLMLVQVGGGDNNIKVTGFHV